MSFDHLRIPLSAYQKNDHLSHVAVRVYEVLSAHYNYTHFISYPTIEQIAEKCRVSDRSIQRCLRKLEIDFFVLTESYQHLKDLDLIEGLEFYRVGKPVYILPDFLFLEGKYETKRYKILHYAMGEGRRLCHPRATAMSPKDDKRGDNEGRRSGHLNYLLELYEEQSRLLIEEAQKPKHTTILKIEECLEERRPPSTGEIAAISDLLRPLKEKLGKRPYYRRRGPPEA